LTSAACRGLPVALEGALKLKEISYVPTDAYAAGEMKHGPIALLGRDTPLHGRDVASIPHPLRHGQRAVHDPTLPRRALKGMLAGNRQAAAAGA